MGSKLGLSAAFALLVFAVGVLTHLEPIVVASIVVVSTTAGQTLLVPLRSLLMIGRVATLQVLERGAGLLLLLPLVGLGMPGATSLWIALSVGSMFAGGVAYAWTPVGCRPAFSLAISNPWRGSGGFGLGSLAGTGQQLDVPLLGVFGGSAASGLYGSVRRWTQPLGMPVNAFATAALPQFAKASSARAAIGIARSGWWLIALSIGGALGVIVTAPWLVEGLLGAEYVGATGSLRWMALATIAAAFNQPIAVLLQARRAEGFVAAAFLGTVLCQLGLVTLLASRTGALGAGLAMAVSQILLLLLLAIRLHRLLLPEKKGNRSTRSASA